ISAMRAPCGKPRAISFCLSCARSGPWRHGFEASRHATQEEIARARGTPVSMTSWSETGPRAGSGWLKVAALILALAVLIFTGEVTARLKSWLAAVALVAIALAAQVGMSPPRLEEGHNVFLPGAQGEVLRRGLPAPVYARLAAAFDVNYPAAVRCRSGTLGCWQDEGAPNSLYAFSADGVWHKSAASRAVSALDFSDPVRLKLGFVNE